MKQLLLFSLVVLVAACSQQADISTQQVETEGYWVLVNNVEHGSDDCRLTFAEIDGVLNVIVLDPINQCSLASTEFIEYELVHRDESADSPSRFTSGGLKRFDARPVRRYLESYRAFTVQRLSEATPDASVTLIPR